MTRWLAISNRTNSDITVRKHLWGVPKRAINQISKTHPGDTLLVYVGQQVIDKDTTLPPAITGCFEITSAVYEDEKPVFTAPPKLGNEVFPLRIKLKTVRIFDPPVEFKPLIPHLAFITNKKQWSGHIRGQAMRAIPEEDYESIMKAAETPRE
ncbi:MAG TPA: EVE domain-containing protein [Methanoculleus sp.]|nr:EVE domain-containing protein [Methanoculleus sp.]